MDAWTRTLSAVSLASAVVVSTVAWLIVAALLPSGLGSLLMLVGLAAVAVLWLARSGPAGGLVDRVGVVLAGAREPTSAEAEAMAPVLSRLADLEVDPMRWMVARAPRPYPPVRPFGRDQVVVSPVLAEAVFRRQVGVEEAAALIAHTIGWLRSQPTRGDVAAAALILPWCVVSKVIVRVGAAARWIPLVGLAWRLRFVVGAVAVVQSAVEGRIALAVLVAVFITLTYVTPTARRVRGARVQASADQYVVSRGLGPTLLRAMYLVGAPTPDMERTSRLQREQAPGGQEVGPQRRALRLVPS